MLRRTAILALLLFAVTRAFASTHIWTGAVSERFSDAGNWIGGSPADDPVADLSFPGGARLVAINDLSALSAGWVTFSGSGYLIGGNAMSFRSGAITDVSAGPNRIAFPIVVDGTLTFDVRAESHLTIDSAISGAGSVVKAGVGVADFAGDAPNTLAGRVSVMSGELRLRKSPGVTAVPVGLDIKRRPNEGPSRVVSLNNEQIADTATITVSRGELCIGGQERVGSMSLESSADVRTTVLDRNNRVVASGRLLLGGHVTVGDASLSGDIVFDQDRRIDVAPGEGSATIGTVSSPGPNAVLSIGGGEGPLRRDLRVYGGYAGQTIVTGGLAIVFNPSTHAVVRGGVFAGHVASVTAEGGVVGSAAGYSLTSNSDLRLTSGATVRPQLGDTRITLNGTLDLGNARLDVPQSSPASPGAVHTIIRNNSNAPAVGTFAGLAQGSLFDGRYRISYIGGDGNDVTLTDEALLPSGLSLTVTPHPAESGQPVTLRASVWNASSGTVTFSEGATVLATVPLAGGSAETTVTPLPGMHSVVARYGGSPLVLPSEDTLSFRVYYPAPVVTQINPAQVQSGETTTVTLHGSNFLADATVRAGAPIPSPTTFISSSELRLEYHAPAVYTETQAALHIVQDGRSFGAGTVALLAAPPPPPPPISFEAQSVSAQATPGAMTAWLSATRDSMQYTTYLNSYKAVLTDDDNDGLLRWPVGETLPYFGLWAVADLTSRTVSAAAKSGTTSTWKAPVAFPRAIFLRDVSGNYSHVQVPPTTNGSAYYLWARPDVGAWATPSIADGSVDDLDGESNLVVHLSATSMRPVGASPAAPAGILPGDVFLAIDWFASEWFGERVDVHLSESDGSGVFLMDGDTLIVPENRGQARIAVVRKGGSDGEVRVAWRTLPITASSGVQFEASAGALIFGPGEILKFIEVPLIDDAVYSGTSTFAVELSSAAGTIIGGPASRTVEVRDDDPRPTVTWQFTATEVPEGDDGERAVSATLVLEGATRIPIAVSWSTSMAGQPTPPVATDLVFAPGETSKAVIASFRGDAVPEPDGFLTFSVGSQSADVSIPIGTRSVRIVDDDFSSVSISDVTVREGDGVAVVTMTCSPRSERTVTITYRTRDGWAAGGSDYSPTAATVAVNAAVVTITIPLLNDTLTEGDESFFVDLVDVVGGRVGRQTGVVQVMDDDGSRAGAFLATATAIDSSTITVVFHGRTSANGLFDIERSSVGGVFNLVGRSSGEPFTDNSVESGRAYAYRVRVFGTGDVSNIDIATTAGFTDDPLVPGKTEIHARHANELRAAVNALRSVVGLPPLAGATTAGASISAAEISNLRAAVSAARAALGLPTSFATASITPGMSIKASDFQEIREACR